MEKDLFNMLSKSILDTQMDGKNILYFSGKFAGYEYAKIRKVRSMEELKIVLNSVFRRMSLGRIESIEKSKNILMIKISKTFKYNCFLAGFVTGIVSKALDYNFYRFTGKEIKCKNSGKYCTFEIRSI
jgi:hypothetical protein